MEEPIVIKNLTKDYDGFRAVDSLDLTVKKNTFIGFLGPNGAGKTTTIKILTSLLNATEGEAFLNGVDVTKRPKKALSGVGAVVETPEFYPYLNPRESLLYLGRLRGMTRESIEARTSDLLKMVKLTEWGDQRIGKFSKGMKQRLAIAQALLHRPNVIILDEPTSGLDPRGMVEVRNILKELRQEDYTIFMSSHLLNEVQEICDYVALIDQGKLLAHGEVSDLVSMGGCTRLSVSTVKSIDERTKERISDLERVREVKAEDKRLIISHEGGEAERAELLRELLALDIEVFSFKEESLPLESLYMDLIKDSR